MATDQATRRIARSANGGAGRERVETVIVGGGQAGLATAFHLRKLNRPCVVLDAQARVGDSWRRRWPSLRLYSPAAVDGLPGMPFPAPRHAFPTGNAMADYLESYAERFDLPVRTGMTVEAVSKDGDRYVVTTAEVEYEADNVVVATGAFRDPLVPDFASQLDAGITQLHSHDYRGPEQLRDGAVLVVGAAHSGSDIAFEVAAAGHRTILSGRDTGELPFRVDGRAGRLAFPLMRFAAKHVLTVDTPIGRKARRQIRSHGGPLLRIKTADLLAAGVDRVHARTVGVADGMPLLDDGRVVEVTNVVWCTGFRNDYGWIRFPLPLDEDGFPAQYRGAVPSLPGLYFVGLLFLHSFSSMLIVGADRDGKRVAKHIAARVALDRPAAAAAVGATTA